MEKLDHYLNDSKILYVVKIDLEGNYTYISPLFAEVFNFDPEKIIGTNSLLTIFKKDHQRCMDTVNKCIQNPNTYQKVSFRKPIPNGEFIWSQWEFCFATDNNNQAKEIICFGMDISEKINQLNLLKSAIKKIDATETKYQSLFETSSLAIVLHTPDGTIYDANEVFCAMVEVSKNIIKQYNLSEFTPDSYLETDKAFIDLLINNQKIYSYEKEFITAKGKLIPISINPKIFFDQTKKMFVWSIIKDITERKNHFTQLEEQKELLEQTTHIAKLGGWEIDFKSLKSTWTKEVYKIHEVEEDYQPGIKNELYFFQSDYRKTILCAIIKAKNEGVFFDLELKFISANKTKKWVRVAGQPVYLNDAIICVKGIIQDITEKKLSKETIDKQNNLIKDFAFTQSHIIRLPIANIVGLTDLLGVVETEEEKLDIYQKIKTSVSQLDKMIKDVATKKIED